MDYYSVGDVRLISGVSADIMGDAMHSGSINEINGENHMEMRKIHGNTHLCWCYNISLEGDEYS
ncbi:MAG: hypothetical protein QXR06_04145 [Candidatus Bathyarchaeia archaeon]|nr:hypothetical protein [Candidatus Bathyarchaeota archaeon]